MDRPEASAATPVSGSRTYWIVAALVLGMIAGALLRGISDPFRSWTITAASAVGGLWLNALRMTVIPLIVALLVTGVAKGADAARSGRVAAKSIAWFMTVYLVSAIIGVLVTPLLLKVLPLEASTSAALSRGFAAISKGSSIPPTPSIGDFFRDIIPSNILQSGSNGDILQIVIFTLLFSLAIARLSEAKARHLVEFFEAVGDALLVVIGWVLWLAPLGVLALAIVVGASAGGAALAGVLHYVIVVTASGVPIVILAYVIAVVAGRLAPVGFTRAMLAPQALAVSTQSSLACLPVMLVTARALGVRQKVADVVLPLAVALFRPTGPGMNIAVVMYLAHMLGLHIGMVAIISGVLVAAITEFGSVSLPGQLSYFTAVAPICVAMGVPVAPLLLFVAVDTIPDILRTVGNVTMDVAVAASVDRSEAGKSA